MWLQHPKQIDRELWQGRLIPANPEENLNTSDDLKDRGLIRDICRDLSPHLPMIKIGKPISKKLNDDSLKELLTEDVFNELHYSNFFLSRFVCSFLNEPRMNISWARFRVIMENNKINGETPLAYDLYPTYVSTSLNKRHKISIGSKLKFHVVQIEGSQEDCLEYFDLQPVISAAGAMTPNPSWDYYECAGKPIIGDKWMYLIIKCPKEMQFIDARIDLVARVRVNNVLINAVIPDQYTTSLKVTL
jgi:hypothetical protein